MKKLLLFLTLMPFCIIQSQTFNKCYHTPGDMAGRVFTEINNEYYFMTESYAFPTGPAYLYKHDSNGNLKFRKPVNHNVLCGIKSLDNKLITLGRYNWCDVSPDYEIAYLSKIDTNGAILFTVKDTLDYYGWPSTLFQHSDSSYYFFFDSVCYRHDKNGQLMSKTKPGFTNVSAALELQNNDILLSVDYNGSPALVTMSPSGVITGTNSFAYTILKFQYYGGQKIMGLGLFKKLYSISPNLKLITQGPFLNGLWASDFYVKNDSVYTSLFVTNAPDQTSYAITDTSFNIIYSSPTISIEGMAHCSILPTTNNRVALYSYGDVTSVGFQFGNGANCFSSLTMLNRFSGTNYKNDIALVSLTVDSLYHTGFTNSPSGSVNIKARVMVKNKGTTAITQFDLSCYEYTSIDGCNKYYYNERFSNLNILPGDSIEVTTGSFVTKYYPTITGGNPYTISSDYCFYTSVPDNEVDKTMLDNQFCKNVSFTVTGMDETSSLENSFKVFPNPTENDFAITSSAFIRSVEAYNIHGELICRQILAAHETIIGNDFKSGIYFLRINTDKGSVTRKIIKN